MPWPKVVTATLDEDGSVDLDCHGLPIGVAEQVLLAALTMLSRTLEVSALKQALFASVVLAKDLPKGGGGPSDAAGGFFRQAPRLL